MKKISLIIALVLIALGMNAADYGIMVNGTTFHAGTQNTSPMDPSFQEYMVLDIQLNANDQIQLYDNENKAGWAVTLDVASVAGIVKESDHYTCQTAGCYSFYIKLKFNADQLYIGNGNCSSEPGNGGNVTPPSGEGNPRYYYKGYFDGEDIEPSDATLFNGGIAQNVVVYENAYIFVLYQVDGVPGVQYMTQAYEDGVTHATLLTNGSQKMHLGPGTYTLYLYDNGNGTLELSTQQMPGKTLVSTGSTGLDELNANTQNTKFIENGKLYIRRGHQVFDAMGKAVK